MDDQMKTNGAAQDRDVMYQVSLLQSLVNGDYHGSITLAELKQHGDTGIGTFDGLNGELIMLDGKTYRAAGDGSVEAVTDDVTIPFSVVTFMDADKKKQLKDIVSFDALCAELNQMVAERGKNQFYMIRIDGAFREVNVRSVYAQHGTYRRLTEVMEDDQTFYDYQDVEGTIIGLYCPPYMSYLNAVGWHMHFISKDRTKGGHVLGMNIADAELTWDDTNGFEMRLPQAEAFSGFDLTADQSEDIEKVEKGKKG